MTKPFWFPTTPKGAGGRARRGVNLALGQLDKFNKALGVEPPSTNTGGYSPLVPPPEVKKQSYVIRGTTPRTVAESVSSMLGGAKAGVRMLPSKTAKTVTMTVRSSDGNEMGERLIRLYEGLKAGGYRRESEGVFVSDKVMVHNGRVFVARGKRPMGFLLTVEVA